MLKINYSTLLQKYSKALIRKIKIVKDIDANNLFSMLTQDIKKLKLFSLKEVLISNEMYLQMINTYVSSQLYNNNQIEKRKN